MECAFRWKCNQLTITLDIHVCILARPNIKSALPALPTLNNEGSV